MRGGEFGQFSYSGEPSLLLAYIILYKTTDGGPTSADNAEHTSKYQ